LALIFIAAFSFSLWLSMPPVKYSAEVGFNADDGRYWIAGQPRNTLEECRADANSIAAGQARGKAVSLSCRVMRGIERTIRIRML
jgi:hypothetical protein